MPTKGPAGPGSPYPPLSPFLPFSPGKPLSPYTLTTNSRLDIPTQIYMFTFKSNCMIWLICDHVHLSQCSYRQKSVLWIKTTNKYVFVIVYGRLGLFIHVHHID